MEIKEIEFESECYPRQLKNIQNPPQKLYVLGDEKILNNECISIVGSRCCTSYGADIAKRFANYLGQNEITIVSGMAKGIDSHAHLGAMETKGKTIAVLGSGFEHIFPSKIIFEKILENNGTIISEYSPEVEVFPQGFRDRNRIIAGMSLGTLVVEAKTKSGTGITAEYVKKFKRKLFCIPHSIEDKAGIGTNRLIKKGAILVTEPKDILDCLKKQTIIQSEAQYDLEIPLEYRKIYNSIKQEALNADEISKKTGENIANVNTILTMLELEGYIESFPGNNFKAKEW